MNTISIQRIPDSFRAVSPMLTVKGAADAIAFYKTVFGATDDMCLTTPTGMIVHAELNINGHRIMLGEEDPQFNQSPTTLGGTTVFLHVYVDDVDATCELAIANGAEVIIPIADQFYGDRTGRIKDPFGHIWLIATHIEDISTEEMQKRFDAMCGGASS